jgi:hypothetical protein
VTSELKACPFCGAKADSKEHRVFGLMACCSSTGCEGHITWICADNWNRRVSARSDAVARLVEASKRASENCDCVYCFRLRDALAAVEKEIGT